MLVGYQFNFPSCSVQFWPHCECKCDLWSNLSSTSCPRTNHPFWIKRKTLLSNKMQYMTLLTTWQEHCEINSRLIYLLRKLFSSFVSFVLQTMMLLIMLCFCLVIAWLRSKAAGDVWIGSNGLHSTWNSAQYIWRLWRKIKQAGFKLQQSCKQLSRWFENTTS